MKKLLVTDSDNNRLRILDRQSNMTYSLCTGDLAHTDGDMESCTLSWPHSLMVSGDSLYIGEYQMIRIISGMFMLLKHIPNEEKNIANIYIPILKNSKLNKLNFSKECGSIHLVVYA